MYKTIVNAFASSELLNILFFNLCFAFEVRWAKCFRGRQKILQGAQSPLRIVTKAASGFKLQDQIARGAAAAAQITNSSHQIMHNRYNINY